MTFRKQPISIFAQRTGSPFITNQAQVFFPRHTFPPSPESIQPPIASLGLFIHRPNTSSASADKFAFVTQVSTLGSDPAKLITHLLPKNLVSLNAQNRVSPARSAAFSAIARVARQSLASTFPQASVQIGDCLFPRRNPNS